MEWERGGNNAKHRWVPDTKENRQIKEGRMWKRIRLTHWRPGLERSTACAHWRSCRISNPEQRPSLPSKCVVWLSSDHPHAGYGNLRDRKRWERYLWFVFAAYSSQFVSCLGTIFSDQLHLRLYFNSASSSYESDFIWCYLEKNMHVWTKDF